MKIDDIKNQIEKVESYSAHVGALLQALGDPSRWEFTGTVADSGPNSGAYCACGHQIRWLFYISHPDGRGAQVGSTCIDHIGQINPALGKVLVQARTDLEARLAEAKKKAKQAADEEENKRLWAEFVVARDAVVDTFRAMRQRGVLAPYELFYFNRKHGWRKNPPEYTRPCDLKKWLTSAINKAKSLV